MFASYALEEAWRRRALFFKMVPGFDNRGLLPEGVHEVRESDIGAQLADTAARQQLFSGFVQLRRDAEALGLAGTQWVDGSFVTSKAELGDLDVVTFCDYDLLNRLGPSIQAFYGQALSAKQASIPTYGCDTYALPACGDAHPYFPVFDKMRRYWRKHFATVHDPLTGRTIAEDKGFVSLSFGDPSLVPTVSTLR